MHPNASSCSNLVLLLFFAAAGPFEKVLAQCAGLASTPRAASDCVARSIPIEKIATIDPNRSYTLAELIDIAEHNNPRTRVVWERAKQKADQLNIEKSAYYPVLAAAAVFSDERIIEPFPKPLAPRGYTMVEIPLVEPESPLESFLFDFGKREAKVDGATAEKIA